MKSDFWYYGCEKKNPPQVAFVYQCRGFEFGADVVRQYQQSQTSKLVFLSLLSYPLILTLFWTRTFQKLTRVDFSFQPRKVTL